ncbi:unnamed protein product [Phytomonas sp. EM1]|nr:unnamed protein product [Phytomonas sp. EM1]|eukprot:CCW59708.1 unnamed protein product [Phytomonas sp. isolate EM1]
MSEVNVLHLLSVAYSGTKEERTSATAQLESLFKSDLAPHYILTVLRSAVDSMVPVEQSLSALIYVKNCLMYTTPEEVLAETPEIFEQIKQTLFTGVFQVPATHRRVICECVSTLISGFKWNFLGELLPMVDQLSIGGSTQKVADTSTFAISEQASAVLEMLYTYTKRFKTPNLEPMPLKLHVCSALMKPLLGFLEYNNFHISKMVFKVAEGVVETALQQRNAKVIPADSFDEWFSSMVGFLEKKHQDASVVGGKIYEEYVKCVKRIAMISFSVMNDATRHKKPAPVATRFLKVHAATFFGIWQGWLGFCLQSPDRERHRKSEMFAIQYLKMCTLDEALYTGYIRPAAMSIIEHLLFPYLCFGDEDEGAFADDTDLTDYVQYMMDEGLDGGEFTPRQVASHAILAVIGGKKRFHDAPGMLQALLHVLTAGLALETNETNFPRLFGFLQLLSILRRYLRGVGEVWEGQMALVLMRDVAPRLRAEVEFIPLRCKAVEVCQRYAKVPMPTEHDFAAFIAMMGGLIGDGNARVRLAAIDAMCTLLEMKRARPYLLPVLVPLVEECIAFMNRVQTTFVPTVILHLATHFAPEMASVMGKLGRALVQHFLASAFELEQRQQQELEMDSDNLAHIEQMALSADAQLEAIYTVVLSCSENKPAFLDMRADILRLIRAIIEHSESFDFMEKALDIFLHVVRFSESEIPSEAWELLPVLFQAVDSGVGVDFFVNIEEVLDNFVSGVPLAFLTNAPIMEATFNACQKMLIGGVVCAPDCKIAAAKLIEALLHQAKGCSEHPGIFDAHLPYFVNLLLKSLVHPDMQENPDTHLRVWIVAALMDCFFFNAHITFDTLVQSNACDHFFHGFFHLFRGCIPQFAAATAHRAAPIASRKKNGVKSLKKNPEDAEAAEVVESLSILTRKVIILGLTSLMEFVLGCCEGGQSRVGAVSEPTALATRLFVEQHLPKAVALVQYCIFTNEGLYAARCRVSERSLHDIRTGADTEGDDDADLHEDDEMGLDDINATSDDDDDDDFAEINDDDGDEDGHSNPSDDEGDDYESPIDDINEVQFFLRWLGSFMHQAQPGVGARESVLAILRAESEYVNAEQTAQKYRQLWKELEEAMRQDFQTRQRQATG